MGRQINKLSALMVAKEKQPGYYGDGAGLYLQVSPTGTKSWILKFTLQGKAREMGLGPLHTISLADAREIAITQRKLILEGKDPIAEREAARQRLQVAAANRLTFNDAAKEYIDSQKAGWKNAKHADQWTNTLATYAAPIFGHLPVADIDTGLVVRVLKPIWDTKTETASRVRGRIESILNWAATQGYRPSGDNPARWNGHLENLFARPSKVQKVKHHAALPFAEIGTFVEALHKLEGVGTLALEFTILTACRTNEVIGATWGEIDLAERVWTIPAERMKAEKEHRVPLSDRAAEILGGTPPEGRNGYVFPGAKPGKPLSNMAMLALLGRRDNSFPAGSDRACLGAPAQGQSRGVLRTRHAVRQASPADGSLGEILQHGSNHCGSYADKEQDRRLTASGKTGRRVRPTPTDPNHNLK